jgi:hypothetical protein
MAKTLDKKFRKGDWIKNDDLPENNRYLKLNNEDVKKYNEGNFPNIKKAEKLEVFEYYKLQKFKHQLEIQKHENYLKAYDQLIFGLLFEELSKK